MESHTVLGANILEAVARQHGACLAFLQMAIDIVRHHHERYDGSGYPDGLAGDAIPLAARITAIADVYDAMRSKLVYKPGLSHAAVRRLCSTPTRRSSIPPCWSPSASAKPRSSRSSSRRLTEQTGNDPASGGVSPRWRSLGALPPGGLRPRLALLAQEENARHESARPENAEDVGEDEVRTVALGQAREEQEGHQDSGRHGEAEVDEEHTTALLGRTEIGTDLRADDADDQFQTEDGDQGQRKK